MSDSASSAEPSATPVTTLPLVYTRKELAAALQVSPSTLDAMRAAGRLPSPLADYLPNTGINRSKYWSRVAIQAWVDAGCPDVAEWERQRRRA